ncbi:signal recognition particle protein [Candidatus Heimdallarchaeota archaeon]|jgi:signal recognition particle subunit SRP54|nr:MAG: signal recognition particle protein [Candidatus Heimdallarchaeota archaeon]
MVLRNLGSSITNALKKLVGATTVDADLIRELKNDLLKALLAADVKLEIAIKVADYVEERALKEELPPGIPRQKHIVSIVHDQLVKVMGAQEEKLNITPGKTNTLLFVGIQGSGKTTCVAKVANWLNKRGMKPSMVCADTDRPGAYEQLKQLGDKIHVPVYGDPEAKNAIKLAQKGVAEFAKKKREVILIDTAGRHRKERAMLKEMHDIAKKIEPDEIILVIDGTLGQQAYEQARAFAAATDIGSIVVTKLDGSAKGGGALSACAATKAPIKFIGVGEKVDDFEKFDPTGFVGRLLNMGDIEALLESVKAAQIEPDEEAIKAFMTGKFTLRDMYAQMENIGKMGSIGKLLSFLPGFSQGLPEGLEDTSEENMKKFMCMMESMTADELNEPSIIKSSRVDRIAKGSGCTQAEVKQLLKQFFQMRKMMKQMKKGFGRRGAKIPNIGNLNALQKGMDIPKKYRRGK